MANTIKQKRGTTDPAAGDLVVGELAINTTDGGVFTKTDSGSVVEVGAGGGGGGELQQDAYDNLYAGDSALSSWTGTVSSSNVVIGTNAGLDLTDGLTNVLIGKNAGQDLTTGDRNIAIGTDPYTGSVGATGNDNICMGRWTGYALTTGAANVFIGARSGESCTAGAYNVYLGELAGRNMTIGTDNIYLGRQSGESGNGYRNVAIGYRSGTYATGTDNTIIGSGAQYNTTMSGTNNILIGYNAFASTTSVSNEITLGNASITSFRIPGLQSGATNGDVLTYNSTNGNLELATPSGGGLTYFTEAESTASPNNIVSVDSFTAAASTTNADIALVPKGSGALLGQIPDNATTGGGKRGAYATDWQRVRGAVSDIAAGDYSTIGGGSYNFTTTAASYATITGGYNNECTAPYATAGGEGCDGDGSHSVAFGDNVNAVGSRSVALGASHYAGGQYSAAIGGYAASADGAYSAIIGSYIGYALASHSIVLGGSRGQTGTVVGRCVIPACNSPVATSSWASQSSILLCGRQTTSATTTSLGSDSTTVDANNILTLTNNSAFYVKGSCIAGVTGAGNTKAWTFEAVIKRGASASTTTFVGSVIKNVIAYDSGAAAWDINVVADTSLGGIRVEVTGAASTTIRWVTKFESTETAY